MSYALTLLLFLVVSLLIPFKINKCESEQGLFLIDHMVPVRGFCALVIFLLHLCYPWAEPHTEYYVRQYAYMAVGMFFLLSGYGLFLGMQKVGKKHYFKEYFKKRIPRLMLPYLIMLVVILFLRCVLWGRGFNLLFFVSIFTGDYVPNSWFVYALLLFYIFFYFCFRFFDNKKAILLLFGLIAICCGLVIGFRLNSFWISTCFMFPFGTVLGYFKKYILKLLKNNYLYCFLISGGAVVLVEIMLRLFKLGDWTYTVCYNIRAAVFLSFCAVVLYKIRLNNPALKFLGNISYEFYLVHGFIMSVVEYQFAHAWPVFSNSYVFAFSSLILSAAAAYALRLLDNRILNKKTAHRT
ncbi:MAG: acyltransferase [Clostridia bacterium]|nr:acyltransferase [Clostridia bacterium]